jgi:hypothetical protein
MHYKKYQLRSILILIVMVPTLIMFTGCKKGIGDLESIILNIEQSEWNFSGSGGSGIITVFMVGGGIDKIILDSITMRGDNDSATPLKAQLALLEGNSIKTEFPKDQVLGLLLNPTAGSKHTISLMYNVFQNPEPQESYAEITVSNDSMLAPSGFTLEIDPYEWNLNFVKSSGTVEAFIRGEGIDNIDLNSFEMTGDNPSMPPIPAISATLQGDHIHARFAKNQLIDLLLNPETGSIHTINISATKIGGTNRYELTADITIIADEEEDIDPTELILEIDPDEWNLNFTKSSGTVEAFIQGEGIEKIDLNSIQMEGDNPTADPLPAISATLQGDHIHARFPKNQVIGLLLNPEEGSTHTITISATKINGIKRFELTATITIIEDDEEEDIEPGELTLKISPSTWNLNYPKSSGDVKAFIQGEGIDKIDLDAIEMTGDNPSASLLATSASLEGNHVKANFPKSLVLDLLLNPTAGSVHTVTVTISAKNSNKQVELSADVTIEGSSD